MRKIDYGKSLMKTINCKGPCLDPPGTPVEIKLFSEGNSIVIRKSLWLLNRSLKDPVQPRQYTFSTIKGETTSSLTILQSILYDVCLANRNSEAIILKDVFAPCGIPEFNNYCRQLASQQFET